MFNVIRFNKVKNFTQQQKIEEHNFRKNLKIKNVNYKKVEENIFLIGDKNTNLKNEYFNLKNNLNFTDKKNSVLYDEFVISASKEFFQDKTKQEIIKYFQDNINILKKHFFKVPGSVVSAVIHFDELTPHMHVVACPLVKTTEKEIKRGKDKGKVITGEFYTLSHDRLFGNKEKCRELQDVFNQELNKLEYNLKRGHKNTGRSHKTVKEFNKEIEKFNSFTTDDFNKEIKKIKNLENDFENSSFFKKILKVKDTTKQIKFIFSFLQNNLKQYKSVKRKNNILNIQNNELNEKLNFEYEKNKRLEQETKNKVTLELNNKFKLYSEKYKTKILYLENQNNNIQEENNKLKQNNDHLKLVLKQERKEKQDLNDELENIKDIIESNEDLTNHFNEVVEHIEAQLSIEEELNTYNQKWGYQRP